jgi:hypothetical protein
MKKIIEFIKTLLGLAKEVTAEIKTINNEVLEVVEHITETPVAKPIINKPTITEVVMAEPVVEPITEEVAFKPATKKSKKRYYPKKKKANNA